MRSLVLGLLVVTACRYHFDAHAPDSGSGDAPSDGLGLDAFLACTDLAQPVPASGAIAGTIAAGGGAEAGSCGGSDSTENVYSIDVTVPNSGLEVATDSGNIIDTMLYMRTACADASSEFACDNNGGIGEAAADRATGLPIGRYYIFVDGESGSAGSFTGTAQVLLPAGATCGGGGRERCAPDLACSGTCMPAGCAITEQLTGSNSYERVVDTSSAPDLHAGTCGEGNDGGTRGPEVIYQVQLSTAVTNIHVSTDNAQTDYDTLIYVRHDCAGPEIACDDDSGSDNHSILDTGAVGAGTYDIFIDGFATNAGMADVTVTITP